MGKRHLYRALWSFVGPQEHIIMVITPSQRKEKVHVRNLVNRFEVHHYLVARQTQKTATAGKASVLVV